MFCPDCGFDNIDGAEECAECGVSLVVFDAQGNEVERSISSHSVAVLTPREPVCVQAEAVVRDVLAQMSDRNIGCVLVEDGADLVGIFSERDVLNKVTAEPHGMDRPVRAYMTPKPLTITRRDSIGYALQAMDLGGYRHLPVVNSSGIAIGIISVRDILRFLCVKYARSRG
jgi:CBS domain-containing protein